MDKRPPFYKEKFMQINIKGNGWAIIDGEYIVYDKKEKPCQK